MYHIGLLTFRKGFVQTLTFDELAVIKRKLDECTDILPEAFQPDKNVLSSQLILHVQHCQFMKTMAQLIVKTKSIEGSKQRPCGQRGAPQPFLHGARIMLEKASYIYYARHGFESCNPWVAFILKMISKTVIDGLKAKTNIDASTLIGCHLPLVLSAQALANQNHYYHKCELLAAQLQSAISPQELQLVCTYARVAGMSKTDQSLVAEHSSSHWPLPGKVVIDEDLEKVKLDTSPKGLEEIQLWLRDESETSSANR
ncbi:hypothetical protein J3E74DRAFT_293196 [Bipolaris maydis]|nr:hypothetical protein J3E74DRAFT_293196 [Bipolaris maydis]KAJ6278493.1 hypothetical protein J3E71DRAFT_243491 [Bipolaris maydis]